MTEKQRKLLENLPKCKNNMAKAARLAGYSESFVQGRLYDYVRKCKGLERKSEEEVREGYIKKVKKIQKKMLKDNDNTNLVRSIELEGKVNGLFKDNTQSNQQGSIVIIDSQGLTKTVKAKPLEPETVKADGHPTEEGM